MLDSRLREIHWNRYLDTNSVAIFVIDKFGIVPSLSFQYQMLELHL